MIIDAIGTDDLTIDLVKNHLNIDVLFTADDTLLNHQLDASLIAVENYCQTDFLLRTYISESYELEIENNSLYLDLVYTPKTVTITTLVDGDIVLNMRQWYHSGSTLKIGLSSIDYTGDITKVQAVGGSDKIGANINQARLLTVGSWYAAREDTILGLSVNSLPDGVKYVLTPEMAAAI